MNLRVIVSKEMDVYTNFAIEKYLINHIDEDEVILFLWQSKKNVMLGKNQNPVRECNVKLLQDEGGVLCRRITGGGAIYCDHGNMLFSFIVPKTSYDLSKQLQVILDACRAFGVNAEKSGRNDLTIEGRKFSGNAFYHTPRVSLHHGSLLIDEDISNLVRYLTPSLEKVTSKGIQSVRSRVTNLSAHNPEINVASLREAIIESFGKVYNHEAMEVIEQPDWINSKEVADTVEFLRSWDWIYGNASEADVVLEKRFDWGEVQLHFKLIKSIIENAVVYSDSLDQDYIAHLSHIFKGMPLTSEALVKALEGFGDTGSRRDASRDMSEWLLSLTL